MYSENVPLMNSQEHACLLSVVVPVYGVEKYIRKCLLSILDQDFQDMEVLVIDDDSKDHSMEIVEEIMKSHPAGRLVRIFRQPHNMGIAMARNRGLEEMRGKYMLFVDSDDWIPQCALHHLYEAAEAHQAEVVYGSTQVCDEEGHRLPFYEHEQKHEFLVLDEENDLGGYVNQDRHSRVGNYVWNILFSTDFIRDNHLRFLNVRKYEDRSFSADFQPLVKKAVLLPDITYNYLIRQGSLTRDTQKAIPHREVEDYINIYEYIKRNVRTLSGKPYYGTYCLKLMLYILFITTAVMKNRHAVRPHLDLSVMRSLTRHPLTFREIMELKHYRGANLFFAIIGRLPCRLSLLCHYAIGKAKHYC